MSMRRAVGVTAAVLGMSVGAVIAPPAAHATPPVTMSPTQGALTNGVATRVTVTGTGFDATSVAQLANCGVPGPPALPAPTLTATGLTVLVPAWTSTTCDLQVVTDPGGSDVTVTAGTYTWTTGGVAYVTLAAPVPSLLPITGDASFLLTANLVNPGQPVGDSGGLSGAGSAVLGCGGVQVPAAVTVLSPNQATITPGDRSAVPAGTPCTVTVTLATGNTVDLTGATPSTVWVDDAVPSVSLSPAAGPENQPSGQQQWITVAGTGLASATGVTFAYCPASNPLAIYPATAMKPTAGGTSLSVQVPSVPAGTCAVVVGLPAAGGRPSGYTVASVPPSGGFTFQPPYQGPVSVQVMNPPGSGIADSSVWVSIMGAPSGGGGVNVPGTGPSAGVNLFAGVNGATLTSVRMTDMATYDPSGHAATLTLTPPVKSGNLYLSTSDLTGDAPNPTNSTSRYGFAEFTYDSAGLDVDLTLIDQIGVTMRSDLYSDQAGTQLIPGSPRRTGALLDLVNALSRAGVRMTSVADSPAGVMRYSGAAPDPAQLPPPGGWTQEFLDDNDWVGLVGAAKSPAAYPSVADYVTGVTGPLTIQDMLGDPTYNGHFDYTATLSGGVWTLTGTLQDGLTQGPKLEIQQAGLHGPGTWGGTGYGVYGQDGPFTAYLPTGTPAAPTYGSASGPASDGGVPTVWQNTVKTIYRDFVAGFAYGYWDSAYGAGVDTGPNAVNFTRNPCVDAYRVAQPTYPDADGDYAWNVYDDIVRSLSRPAGAPVATPSGAYGMPYSDTFVPSALSPNQQQGWARNWTITIGDSAPPMPPGPGGGPTPAPVPSTQPGPTPIAAPAPPLAVQPQQQTLVLRRGRKVVLTAAGRTPRAGAMARWSVPGATGPTRWTVSPSSRLPDGVRFARATGTLTGKPTHLLRRTVFRVTVTDGSGATGQARLVVSVRRPGR